MTHSRIHVGHDFMHLPLAITDLGLMCVHEPFSDQKEKRKESQANEMMWAYEHGKCLIFFP